MKCSDLLIYLKSLSKTTWLWINKLWIIPKSPGLIIRPHHLCFLVPREDDVPVIWLLPPDTHLRAAHHVLNNVQIPKPWANVKVNQRISLRFNGDLMPSKPNLSNSSLQHSFGRGQIVLLPLLLWDHGESVNPQPPVVVSCSALLQRASSNCLCNQKRLLRRSDSVSPRTAWLERPKITV